MRLPSNLTLPILAFALVFVAAGCGGDESSPAAAPTDDPGTVTRTETVEETTTVEETVTESRTVDDGEADDGDDQARSGEGDEPDRADTDPGQDFIVAPQEPIRTVPSGPHDEGGDGVAQFTVGATYDGEMPAGFTLGYVPCESILGSDGPGVAFQDLPEAMGHSDEGNAFMYSIEGERAEPGAASSWPRFIAGDDDGDLTLALNAEQPDCATPIVWEDRDDDSELDLNDAGQPTERYGYGKVNWES